MINLRLYTYGAAAIGGLFIGWWVTSQIAENHLQSELKRQELALHAQCDADKKLTSEVSNGLQKKLSTTNFRLSELKRLHEASACVPITGAASGYDGISSGAQHVGKNGIAAGTLLDYAGDAERYRLQLESCQEFIKKVWSTHR